MTDIKALVAKMHAHATYAERKGDKRAKTFRKVADALARQQAVMKALGKADKRATHWRTSGPHADVVEVYFDVANDGASEFCHALDALDATPEGDG